MASDEVFSKITTSDCLLQEVELLIIAISARFRCIDNVSTGLVFCITLFAFELPAPVIVTTRHITEWWRDCGLSILIECIEHKACDKVTYWCTNRSWIMHGGRASKIIHFILCGD